MGSVLDGWSVRRLIVAGLLALLMLEIDWGDCSVADDDAGRPAIVTRQAN